MANFEKTARMFQARFKQPYSLCACDKSARLKISGSLSIAPKKATSLDDVLKVLGSKASFNRQQVADATHPCSHSMILDAARPGTAGKTKLKGKSLHRNTILDPPPEWNSILAKNAYGYGPAVHSNANAPLAPLRHWATTT